MAWFEPKTLAQIEPKTLAQFKTKWVALTDRNGWHHSNRFNHSSKEFYYSMPGRLIVYYYKKKPINYRSIKDYPIMKHNIGWRKRTWHIVESEKELRRILAMLTLTDYSYVIDNRKNQLTSLIKRLEIGIKNKKYYVSYYYNSDIDEGYYRNGYIDFYCLMPEKNMLVYIIHKGI